MLEILTVCTGNICRSPLAAQLLTTRLDDLGARVTSAGTRARDGAEMTAEAAQLATSRDVPEALASSHRARYLTPPHLQSADLVLAMARDHRREIVELDPARVRTTFTVREFARLANDLTDGDLRSAAASGGNESRARFAAAFAAVAGRRGLTLPPNSLDDDDVIDPFGRSFATYERSAGQLEPALVSVERVIRLALP